VYYFDTYALIEIVKGNTNYSSFTEKTMITSVVNLSEFYFCLLKELTEKEANESLAKFTFEFLEISPKNAINAAIVRKMLKKRSVSYIDCIGYSVAKENGLKFLTGDPAFKDQENVEFIP